jgi:Flp pilus assembly protein TadG
MDSSSPTEVSGKKTFFKKDGFLSRFFRAKSGSAALEFGILIIPYSLIVFATIETFVAYTAEQVLNAGVDEMARKIRTGQITFKMNRPTDKNEIEFRQIFCQEIAVMLSCDETEAAKPKKLYIDLRSFPSFANMPTKVETVSSAAYSDIDETKLDYRPGGPGSLNMLRAMYRWQIMTDLMRPYLTNIRPAGGVPTDYLIVSTTAFKSEGYP